MHRFNETAFLRRVEAAMGRIRTLLDRTRHPQLPADVPHAYDDKYPAGGVPCAGLDGRGADLSGERRADR